PQYAISIFNEGIYVTKHSHESCVLDRCALGCNPFHASSKSAGDQWNYLRNGDRCLRCRGSGRYHSSQECEYRRHAHCVNQRAGAIPRTRPSGRRVRSAGVFTRLSNCGSAWNPAYGGERTRGRLFPSSRTAGNYGEQFGGAGAAINAVTRSGTNQFHGSIFEYFRNSALDARGPFDGPKLPTFRQNQFGASLGGPIRKDKTFFFANYEGLRRGLGLTRVTFVPDANAHNGILPGLNPIPLSPLIQQLLTYYPIPNNSIGGGLGRYSVVATQVGNEDYILGRVDHMISATDSVFARYIRDRADFTDPFSGSNLPLWPETNRTGNHYATIEERHIPWALARTGRCLSRLPRNRRRRLCTGRVASGVEVEFE